jgi:hypothetical protein
MTQCGLASSQASRDRADTGYVEGENVAIIRRCVAAKDHLEQQIVSAAGQTACKER